MPRRFETQGGRCNPVTIRDVAAYDSLGLKRINEVALVKMSSVDLLHFLTGQESSVIKLLLRQLGSMTRQDVGALRCQNVLFANIVNSYLESGRGQHLQQELNRPNERGRTVAHEFIPVFWNHALLKLLFYVGMDVAVSSRDSSSDGSTLAHGVADIFLTELFSARFDMKRFDDARICLRMLRSCNHEAFNKQQSMIRYGHGIVRGLLGCFLPFLDAAVVQHEEIERVCMQMRNIEQFRLFQRFHSVQTSQEQDDDVETTAKQLNLEN